MAKSTNQINSFLNEAISFQENCNLCKETHLKVGQKTDYGSVIICKLGSSIKNSWFATLSPKTGGNPEKDFTIQLMPLGHLTHFSQISGYPELAKNYGIAFARLNYAMLKVMAGDKFKATAEIKDDAVAVGTYGKCTNWKDKKEHLHIKLFPFRGNIGQPYTVDSSFEKKVIYEDEKTGEKFVKMTPIKKKIIPAGRFDELVKHLIGVLQ